MSDALSNTSDSSRIHILHRSTASKLCRICSDLTHISVLHHRKASKQTILYYFNTKYLLTLIMFFFFMMTISTSFVKIYGIQINTNTNALELSSVFLHPANDNSFVISYKIYGD